MALDAHQLAQFAATTLEQLERDEHLPSDAELGDAQLIIEVTGTDQDGDPISMVQGFTMSGRNIAGIGLLMRALTAALAPNDDS